MKKRTLHIALITVGLFTFFSCANLVVNNPRLFPSNPVETFESTDKPETQTYDTLTFSTPWGYNKESNAARLYPIVVAGYWGEGVGQYNKVAQEYPAFVLEYQRDGSYNGQALGQWIKGAVNEGYRIDTDRIYLTGFSRGGSGSYSLAKGMALEDMFFAAIYRCAGQSQDDLTNAIAQHTAVWYHLGLNDEERRVNIARSALEHIQGYECYGGAIETSSSDTITGYERTTLTLTRNGYSMFIYSEYTGMGHTSGPCYNDPYSFPWMFNHSLKYR